jgi:ankyrin repeat protein
VACANGKLDVSRFLIDRGSDINSRDNDGFIPLHMASRFGHVDIARLLLDRGSDVNVREHNVGHPCIMRHEWILELARLLIDRGADVNAQEADRWTLHIASAHRAPRHRKVTGRRGANVDSQNDKEETPLDLRCRKWAPRHRALLDREWRGRVFPG